MGCDSKQSDDDSDVRIYVYSRDRNRCGDKRFSTQEMSFVLHDLKRLTHGWERDIVDAIIDEIEGRTNE